MVAVELHGDCAPRFGAVRDAFAANWSQHGEVGASLCVNVGGETVVDLWGGFADEARSRPWERDTIANVYSSTKGVAAVAAAMLVDRGELDLERPVVDYWPEFGQAGKSEIPVRQLLTHEAGLAGLDAELPDGAALDWDLMVGAFERQAPMWTPGEEMGYHAISYGWLVGEVIRRIDGRTCGEFVRDEIAQPLGIDFYIGLPETEDGRTADLIAAPGAPPIGVTAEDTIAAKALGLAAPRLAGAVNSREWRAAEYPAANGHGNGRSLATIYSTLAQGGGELMSAATMDACGPTERVGREDLVLGFLVRRSLGFILSTAGGRYEWGPNPRTFGHSGAGGSLGFADPDAGIGFGYVMNQMSGGLGADPRWKPMIDAVYASL
ncbi:MAG: beta-lactamase family protein [Chloroflexi bacterium]|nr:beta-lactamase family protein [Chloroflexota bacterium]MYJ02688.1 beta-lactamase family protein [Chloroflexota bacterium]